VGFSLTRRFRGVRYEIRVERHGPGNQVQLEVDGEQVPGTLVRLPPSGTARVQVLARIN